MTAGESGDNDSAVVWYDQGLLHEWLQRAIESDEFIGDLHIAQLAPHLEINSTTLMHMAVNILSRAADFVRKKTHDVSVILIFGVVSDGNMAVSPMSFGLQDMHSLDEASATRLDLYNSPSLHLVSAKRWREFVAKAGRKLQCDGEAPQWMRIPHLSVVLESNSVWKNYTGVSMGTLSPDLANLESEEEYFVHSEEPGGFLEDGQEKGLLSQFFKRGGIGDFRRFDYARSSMERPHFRKYGNGVVPVSKEVVSNLHLDMGHAFDDFSTIPELAVDGRDHVHWLEYAPSSPYSAHTQVTRTLALLQELAVNSRDTQVCYAAHFELALDISPERIDSIESLSQSLGASDEASEILVFGKEELRKLVSGESQYKKLKQIWCDPLSPRVQLFELSEPAKREEIGNYLLVTLDD